MAKSGAPTGPRRTERTVTIEDLAPRTRIVGGSGRKFVFGERLDAPETSEPERRVPPGKRKPRQG